MEKPCEVTPACHPIIFSDKTAWLFFLKANEGKESKPEGYRSDLEGYWEQPEGTGSWYTSWLLDSGFFGFCQFRLRSKILSVSELTRQGQALLITQKVIHPVLAQPGWHKCHPLTLIDVPHS